VHSCSIKSLLPPFYTGCHMHDKRYQALHVLHATEDGPVNEANSLHRFSLQVQSDISCNDMST